MEQNSKPEINLSTYSQLITDKGAKNAQWEKDWLQQIVLEKPDIHIKREIWSLSYIIHKNQLKMH